MEQKSILSIGNSTLRELSKEISVEEIKTSEFQNLIDELVRMMRTHDGVGIAASQIGVMKRIFVMEVANNKRYPDKEKFDLTICINPEIFIITNEMISGWEGCLSVPFYKGMVPRYKKISLKYLNREGKGKVKMLEDFPAIIAQHEIDHLNGILYTDRISDMKTLTYLDKSSQI